MSLITYPVFDGMQVEELVLPPGIITQPRLDRHRLALNLTQGHSVEIKRRNGWEKKFYSAEDLAMVPFDHANIIRWFTEIRYFLVTFEPALIEGLLSTGKMSLAEQRGVQDKMLLQLLLRLRHELQSPSGPGRLLHQSLGLCIAIHMVTNFITSGKKPFAPKGKFSSSQLATVIECLDASVKKDIGLTELAGLLNLSPFHFSHLFRNTLGISPHKYYLHLKIHRAMQAIQNRNSSLTGIAYDFGFSDQSHFSRTFKKIAGISPRQYQDSEYSKIIQVPSPW